MNKQAAHALLCIRADVAAARDANRAALALRKAGCAVEHIDAARRLRDSAMRSARALKKQSSDY